MCYQANAEYAPQLVTVVCSHSHIGDVDITVVLEHAGMDAPGVQLRRIIPGADVGDTAGVEEVLTYLCSVFFLYFPLSSFLLRTFLQYFYPYLRALWKMEHLITLTA